MSKKTKATSGVWMYEASPDHTVERVLLEPTPHWTVSGDIELTILDGLTAFSLGDECDGTPELGCGRFEVSLDGREVNVSIDVLSVLRNDGSYTHITNTSVTLAVGVTDARNPWSVTSAVERGVRELDA